MCADLVAAHVGDILLVSSLYGLFIKSSFCMQTEMDFKANDPYAPIVDTATEFAVKN